MADQHEAVVLDCNAHYVKLRTEAFDRIYSVPLAYIELSSDEMSQGRLKLNVRP